MPEQDAIHIDLALQGGGAHGAFTWGVLDRLLEDRRCFRWWKRPLRMIC